jgi:hypothetical protein
MAGRLDDGLLLDSSYKGPDISIFVILDTIAYPLHYCVKVSTG